MEVLEDTHELVIGSTAKPFQKFLESQRELFSVQVDQLQMLVETQCKLTGINPLSQEMAAGALSMNIGKRPRDLLNPKAVKYMQSVFSIKDAISKKECREICALFGIKVAQVREFFASQRTRVRKFVRMSREKAVKPNTCTKPQTKANSNAGPTVSCDSVPLNSVGFVNTHKMPSLPTQSETLGGIDDDYGKQFADDIYNLMRKEETFSGQTELMERILKIQNQSLLQCFLSKGGVMILTTWLNEAILEEQTTIILIILKVLCHLPLHKAIPPHMSLILQSVNKLRFCRVPEISNKARVLLSSWSKIFAQNQVSGRQKAKKSFGDSQHEILLKQSIGEIMNDESWKDNPSLCDEVIFPPQDGSENIRIMEPSRMLKLLPASSNNSMLNQNPSLGQSRERRKVQLLEHPSDKVPTREVHSSRHTSSNPNRPISADDIQKAKLRAQWMRNKGGKTEPCASFGTKGLNGISPKKIVVPTQSISRSKYGKIDSIKIPARECGKASTSTAAVVRENIETSNISSKLGAQTDLKPLVMEPSLSKCRSARVHWKIPPEMKMKEQWKVKAGESSKEVEVQKNRIRREREIMYPTKAFIPPDPQDPWDLELDHDDTLTPQVPTEPLPDADEPVASNSGANPMNQEPDLELLAVLLKNPELVFALTTGDGCNLPAEERVRLLDMIKSRGKEGVKVAVSMPSPAPTVNGWIKPPPLPSIACHARPSSIRRFPPSAQTQSMAEYPLPSRFGRLNVAGSRWRPSISYAEPRAPHNSTRHQHSWRR